MITKLISHGPLEILTSFITLTGADLVYTSDTCERTLNNAKLAQYYHHYQAY